MGASSSSSDDSIARPISVACPISTVIKHRRGIDMQTVPGGMVQRAWTPRISEDASVSFGAVVVVVVVVVGSFFSSSPSSSSSSSLTTLHDCCSDVDVACAQGYCRNSSYTFRVRETTHTAHNTTRTYHIETSTIVSQPLFKSVVFVLSTVLLLSLMVHSVVCKIVVVVRLRCCDVCCCWPLGAPTTDLRRRRADSREPKETQEERQMMLCIYV